MKSFREMASFQELDGPTMSLRDVSQKLKINTQPQSLRDVLEKGSIRKYKFRLNYVHTLTTRSRHEDTIYVNFGLKVGDGEIQTRNAYLGDCNDGIHDVGLEFGPVEFDDSTTKVVINYQVINKGHSATEDEIKNGLDQGAKNLAESALEYAEEGQVWAAIGAGALSLAALGIGLLFADCDGPLAIDQISTTEKNLKRWTDPSDSYTQMPEYPGIDSPAGCGGNSDYIVNWGITRVFD